MNLYIETENGATKNHPAFEDNLIEAFGSIPDHWEPFIRVDRPLPDLYKVVESDPTYNKVNSVWTDVWAVRDMTAEEKVYWQATVDEIFASFVDLVAAGRKLPRAQVQALAHQVTPQVQQDQRTRVQVAAVAVQVAIPAAQAVAEYSM